MQRNLRGVSGDQYWSPPMVKRFPWISIHIYIYIKPIRLVNIINNVGYEINWSELCTPYLGFMTCGKYTNTQPRHQITRPQKVNSGRAFFRVGEVTSCHFPDFLPWCQPWKERDLEYSRNIFVVGKIANSRFILFYLQYSFPIFLFLFGEDS